VGVTEPQTLEVAVVERVLETDTEIVDVDETHEVVEAVEDNVRLRVDVPDIVCEYVGVTESLVLDVIDADPLTETDTLLRELTA
jgi:hypothetical protein